ncbi:GreA/GreB family elongation factor [Stutzerimonas tarimensis]|uniref:GreA/GreB family elongation factor n=1 Tax=Stutzerimonas tarimensis TaxID=1507735 RepID=A0ABV7T8T1_9GAMM
MNKAELVRLILSTLETDRDVARQALQQAHEAATHSESKAENKYDTRGLEAAYLADGQRRRLHEIELALAAFRLLSTAPSEGGIRVGALVALAREEAERWVFLGPDGAGLKVSHRGREVLVISPRSPLGQALLKQQAGDEVEIRVNGQPQHYEVLAVY